MENLVTQVKINNFKSIRSVVLNDCRRINLFIGKPNVGKSNILEAFTLFCLPYARYTNKKGLQQFIRCENETELFYNGEIFKPIEILVGEDQLSLSLNRSSHTNLYLSTINGVESNEITKNNIRGGSISVLDNLHNQIKSYFFQIPFYFEDTPVRFLQPTAGCNIFNVLNSLPDLKSEISELLKEYGLKLSFDSGSQQIKFWKELSQGEIFTVPFNSIADTLQRMIFYKTAILSNQNSIITFEEPEAHSYPPYISKITTEIIHSESNQFFITTHSPYVVNDFIEADKEELAIYLIDYKNGETVVKRLTDDELNKVYEYGVDLFFNTETFLS